MDGNRKLVGLCQARKYNTIKMLKTNGNEREKGNLTADERYYGSFVAAEYTAKID